VKGFANILAQRDTVVYNAHGFSVSKEPLRDLSHIGSLGFTLVSSVLLFTAIGYGADRLLGTAPWLLVTGVLVGAGLGFYYMVRLLIAELDSSSGADRARDEETGTVDDAKRKREEEGGNGNCLR